MTQFLLKPRREVWINGVRRRLLGCNTTHGTTVNIASGSMTLDAREGTPVVEDEVVIKAGYGGDLAIIFTGTVGGEGLDHFPISGSVNVRGPLGRAEVAPGLPTGAELSDIDGNPIPVAEYAEMTDGAIVMALLDLVGVPYDATAWEEAGWTMGTVLPVTLWRGQTVLSLIQKIDKDTHCLTFDKPDGTVGRVRWTGLPVGVPNLVFQEGVNVASAKRGSSNRQVRNRINVTGVASDVFTVSDTIEAPSRVSPTTGRPYVPDPPGFSSEDYASDHFETAEQVIEFGQAWLAEHNRLEETLALNLPYGHPRIAPGMSCQVFYPSINLPAGTVGRIDRVSHRIDGASFTTDIDVANAYASEGTGTNIKPIASFIYTVLREKLANGVPLYVIQCDASGSTDPDGAYDIPPGLNEFEEPTPGTSHNGIAVYQWASSLGAVTSTADKGKRATFVSSVNPEGETITLTVFDYQGASAASTQTIAFTNTRKIKVRDLWAAVGTHVLFTDDGENTWQEVALAAVGVCRQAADTFQLAWKADEDGGTLHKITTGLVVTDLAGPTGVKAASITWVYPETSVAGRRCWAGTATGQVWFSGDFGETWELKGTVPNEGPIVSITESPFAENQLTVVAYRALYESYDGGIAWVARYEHPNENLFGTGFDAGFEKGFVIYDGDPPAVDPGTEASRIRERDNLVEGDWVRALETYDLPVGTWQVKYSYKAAGGETLPSPADSVVISGANQVAVVAALSPLPPGVIGVYYYASTLPGGSTLRRVGEGTGAEAFTISAAAPPGGLAPVTTNTTTQGIADPTVAPDVTAGAAAAEAPVDWPAHPKAIGMGLYVPLLYVVGQDVADAPQAWVADMSQSFTFERGVYDAALGDPRDIMPDKSFELIVYGAAEEALFKTVDGFQTTCYTLKDLTGAQTGHKIGIGSIHDFLVTGDVIWIGVAERNGSGYFLAQPVINALGTEGFERRATYPVPGIAAVADGASLISAGGGVLLTWAYVRQVATNKQRPLNTIGTNAYRSIDGGITWESLDISWVSWIVANGDGVVYALCWGGSGFDQTSAGRGLYRSDDYGATWTNVFSAFPLETAHSGAMPSALMVSPVDSQVVVLRQNGLYVSTNGGTSFTEIVSLNDNSGFGTGWHNGFSPDGQWLLYREITGTGHQQMRRIAVGGGASVIVQTGVNLSYGGWAYSGDLVYNYGTLPVLVSDDQGATWQDSVGAAQGFSTAIESFLAGDVANGWYGFHTTLGSPPPLLQGPQGATPSTDPWTDLAAQLAIAFPDGAYYAPFNGAVHIGVEEV